MTTKEQVEAFVELWESKEFKEKVRTSTHLTPQAKQNKNLGFRLMARLLGVSEGWVRTLYRFAYKTKRPIVEMVYGGKLAATAVPEQGHAFDRALVIFNKQRVSDVALSQRNLSKFSPKSGNTQDQGIRALGRKINVNEGQIRRTLSVLKEPEYVKTKKPRHIDGV